MQARNRTTGAAVSLTKQSDVKNHLSPRYRAKIHLCEPASQPDATGSPVVEAEPTGTNPSTFAKDYSADHTMAAAPDAKSAEKLAQRLRKYFS